MSERPRPGDSLVVIDDGDLAESLISSLRQWVEDAGLEFRYHRKNQADGLYASRRMATSLTPCEVIVFLDDDVEVPADFLTRLRAHYETDSALMGVGGVDAFPRATYSGYLFRRLFLMASRKPGQLSVTGMGGSGYEWHACNASFDTEFMRGFCMSYRREALRDLAPVLWMVGYSPGEDLLVSKQAGKHGRLIIDPTLKVTHHYSPTNRWHGSTLRSQQVFLSIPNLSILKPTRTARVLVYWSILGRLIYPLVADRWKALVAMMKPGFRPPSAPLPSTGPDQVSKPHNSRQVVKD